jgi:ABC-type Fe3+/spermidine/putrescine transport system ATPase subunit
MPNVVVQVDDEEVRSVRSSSTPADDQALVKLTQVSRYFGKAAAVDRIDLEIQKGEVFALLGASGCGKSTTLRMIAGLEPLDEGSIVMGGRTLADSKTGKSLAPERRDIGIVFQSYAVWPHMSVAKNVEFPLKMRKVGRAERKARVAEILEVTGMDRWANQSATSLSGGQQQRVALARALVYKPELLLLDEPLSNLDARLRTQMRKEIRRLNRELGVTMLFVTHDQDEAFSVADRVGVMAGGRLEQVGTPAEMYDHPQTPYVRDFLGRTLSVEGVLDWSGPAGRIRLDSDSHTQGGDITPITDEALRVRDGERVRVYVRPEDVELRPLTNDALGPNELRGQIQSADYLGDRVEYLVQVADSTAVLHAPRSNHFTVGDAVTIQIDPARAAVWSL